MSKHKRTKKYQIYEEKITTKRRIVRTFNYIEVILITSCFNALFYRFGLDVNPAMGAFVVLFSLVFVVYIGYYVYKKKKGIR